MPESTDRDPSGQPGEDRRGAFVRWLEGVRSGEIPGGPG
jgi:hypothetical protein